MVETTKNKKTIKKVEDEVVKTKTIKSKDKDVKSTDKVVDKKSDTKVKKNTIDTDLKKALKSTEKVSVKKAEIKEEKHKKAEIKEEKHKKAEIKEEKHKKAEIKEEKHKKDDIKEEKHKKAEIKEEKHKKDDIKEEKHKKAEIKEEKHKKAEIKEEKHKKAEIKEEKSSKNILSYIKNAFFDCSLLYKNFFHWNFSKIIIFFWSIALGFLFVLPFIFIFIIYSFLNNKDALQIIGGLLSGTLINDFFGNIILMIILVLFAIIYFYGNILLLNVSNVYLDGKKLSYKKNDYFKFHKIIKYFNLTVLNFLILLIPIIITVILMGILFLVSGDMIKIYEMVSASPFNYFTILSFVFVSLGLISFIYLSYRLIFSYLVYLDESHIKTNVKLLDCIKSSFNKTKKIKSFIKFSFLVIIFLIIILPVKFVGVMLDNNLKMVTDYSIYSNLNDNDKEKATALKPYYYQSLELEFRGYNDEKLEQIANKNEIYLVLFSILSFLFLNGLFLMVLTSFYKRELK
ncbi:MAG: hypothetical protein Q8K30_01705 [Candidatus Gracilibacteria bacterium]|nr:hypothetical protein [Candidatus Gracilibacteria bacterium]